MSQNSNLILDAEFWENANARDVQEVLHTVSDVQEKELLLHWAASYSPDTEVIELLLREGSDVDFTDADGRTPLHCAAAYNTNPNVLKVLLRAGADPSAVDDVGASVLHYAAERNPDPEAIIVLYLSGANLNAVDNTGLNALHYAAGANKAPVVECLLRLGVNSLAVSDHNEETVYDFAKYNENLLGTHVLKLLCDSVKGEYV